MKEKRFKFSDEELIKLYREAKDKNKQIEILADMRCCKPQEIIQMLADAGEIPGMRSKVKGNSEEGRSDGKVKKMKAPRWTSEELEQLQGYIDEGMGYSEIADRFGRNKQSIYDAVSKYKLRGKNWQIQNVLPGEKKVENEEIPHMVRNDGGEEEKSDNPSSVSEADTFSTREKAMEGQGYSNVAVAVFKDMKGLEETQRSEEFDMFETKQENRWMKQKAENVEQILVTVGDYIKILRLGLSDICEDFESAQDTMFGQVAELLKNARLVLKEVYDD